MNMEGQKMQGMTIMTKIARVDNVGHDNGGQGSFDIWRQCSCK